MDRDNLTRLTEGWQGLGLNGHAAERLNGPQLHRLEARVHPTGGWAGMTPTFLNEIRAL